MFETSSSKNIIVKKFHKLTTRTRSGTSLSHGSIHLSHSSQSSPPSPTDYFSQEPISSSTSRSRSGSGFTGPLTPITPTGLAGGANGESLNLQTVLSAPPSAPTAEKRCEKCNLHSSFVDAQSACTCKTDSDQVPGAQEEIEADRMAQQILRRVSADASQGWTI